MALKTEDGRDLAEAVMACHDRHDDVGTKELALLVSDLIRAVEATPKAPRASTRLVKKRADADL